MADVDRRASRRELSARLWLRAYPRRWRYAYGEDLVGTLLDLAGPDARVVRLRDGLSVLRAGWSLRLREHPPLVPWLRYRVFESDLPGQYRVWMIDDLLGRLHGARWYAGYMVILALIFSIISLVSRDTQVVLSALSAWPAYLVLGVVSTVAWPRAKARQVWRKHVSGWVPPELLPRAERAAAVQELVEFRAATGYVSAPHRLHST
ncbi:hypothetical protein [Sanguibacter inulinus]|uniref:Uncharacterized protein n=1 Tax=Sanguibacter inulinus TaxID=60922 RepID=A0A853EU67_9MICO|nr:hypothetical protein [Sanguibacter inulinus]MBF0723101.1 hypothetical protein [Sanguibacter inulinus]NYS94246.1 hypothetical protein [Sanguibacter inulinus]